MIDREKVIKGIECSLNHHTEICEECPYYDLFKQEKHCGRQLKLDTLELLKGQNGKWVWKSGDRYTCSVCGMETSVDEEMEEPLYVYCPFCGAKMEWGGRNGDA